MWVISSPQFVKDPELFVNCFSWSSRMRISEISGHASKHLRKGCLQRGCLVLVLEDWQPGL